MATAAALSGAEAPLMQDADRPSLRELERDAFKRNIDAVGTLIRGRKNLLQLFHPDLHDLPWHKAEFAGEVNITVNDPGLARHVLKDRAGDYPKSRMYDILMGHMLGRSSVLLNGEEWRSRRNLIAPSFNAKSMAAIEPIVTRRVQEVIDRWAQASEAGRGGAVVDLNHDIMRMSMGISLEAFFSTDLGDRADEICDLMDRIIVTAGAPPLADLVGLPSWIPRPKRRKLMGWLEEIDAFLFEVIDQRLARRSEGPRENGDMLDMLVFAQDAETGAHLTRRDIRNEVMTLFAAGYETTAMSLVWGVDRLSREGRVQTALGAECKAFRDAKGGQLTAADTRAFDPMRQAYDEILRLYPPIFNVSREAREDDVYEGFEIPKGATVHVPIFMLHRNSKHWAKPNAFDPGRFSASGRVGRDPFAYIPYGAGPRICVGLALAKLESHLLLTEALARFEIEPTGPAPKPVGQITLRTDAHAKVRLRPRR